MRRALLILTLAAACLTASACEPATPKATIWAKAEATKPPCDTETYISGNVKPATATPKVILQRTKDGKWIDWHWRTQSTGGAVRQLFGRVQKDGTFRFGFQVPKDEGSIYHLRLRSEGGSVVSNDLYITPTDYGHPYPSC